MAVSKKRSILFHAGISDEIESKLKLLAGDEGYNTEASYSANQEVYPDHLIPFVNKHMHYLRTHPTVDPYHYIANLRIMTRIR